MLQDLRYAIRSLSRSRLFVAIAISTLALGIGADTAVFSLVDAVIFRPLPFRDAGRLVDVEETGPHLCEGCAVGTSWATYKDWASHTRSFSSIAAYREAPVVVSVDRVPERTGGAFVTASLFSALGTRTELGRPISPSDDVVGAAPVVVLSDDIWQRRFAGDSSLIGRPIRVNGTMRTVIGVMPNDFHFPEFAALWIPLAPEAQPASRAEREVGVVARLRDGVQLADANAEMTRLAAVIAKDNPATNATWTARVRPLRDDLAGQESQLFVILLAGISLVLLVVCANLAGLLLARGASRRREIAVRRALGASRARVASMLFAESALLAMVGGALGLLLSWWIVDIIAARTSGGVVPYWIHFQFDGRMLAFCVFVSCVAATAFGLLPALRASRSDVQRELKDGAMNASAGRGRSRLRRALVAGELTVALVLLAAAGVLVKSFLRISAPEAGVDRRNLLTANLEFLDARYADSTRQLAAADAILAQIASLPRVEHAALDRTIFVAGFGGTDQKIRAEGWQVVPDGVSPRFAHAVSPDYFATQRLTLAEGRALSSEDRLGSTPVVVVNERLARELWPSQSALGRHIKIGAGPDEPWRSIVGVVADAPRTGTQRPRSDAYMPFAQLPGRPVGLAVRVAGEDPMGVAPSMRRVVAQVDPDLPIVDLMTAEQARANNYWPYKLYAIVMGGFASLAVLLAVIGLYGIVAYSVAQRTREIGIRVALGATSASVVRLIAGEGLRLAILGVVIGLISSIGALRVLRSMLFGASPVDPVVLGVVSVLLAASALLASYLPARRAARIEPAVALRFE